MTNSTDIAVIDLYPASLPSSGRAPVVVVSIGIDVGQATPTAPMPPTDKLEALKKSRVRELEWSMRRREKHPPTYIALQSPVLITASPL